MPLLSVEEVAPGVRLGVWKTVETVDEFFAEYPCLSFLKPKVLCFAAEQRRIEVLAVYSLLYGMGITESLLHDGNGKPLFARSRRPNYEEAVAMYRRLLSKQEDGSVVIVSVGFSTTVAALLKSGPDRYSPLTGRELVARKVKFFSVMGGVKESNIPQLLKAGARILAMVTELTQADDVAAKARSMRELWKMEGICK